MERESTGVSIGGSWDILLPEWQGWLHQFPTLKLKKILMQDDSHQLASKISNSVCDFNNTIIFANIS